MLELLGVDVDLLDQLHFHQLVEELVLSGHLQDDFNVSLFNGVLFTQESIFDLHDLKVREGCDPLE